MPNQRKKGKKKAQFWLSAEQQAALTLLSKRAGITKTEFISRELNRFIELTKELNSQNPETPSGQ